ncbi:hypothetical protein Psuf_059390 [Phytohabitans suffuscus]|uniref:HTH tetR-type domain-containing protein n=1 Tax=Phytohabitans suffuscus TaxID=624315 RepID=A0A6F8YRE1_9ACTN|nr:TetR/AcrR family transcriptional regulator [Phytohabitans suffuscus]BCB88626.1 hypothetical protein Psuf_059390 [Phytohabitans suffuscus]
MLRDAAFELFAVQGYLRTTVDDIARYGGVSRATFYLHYSGKSQIVHEFYEGEWMPRVQALYGDLNKVLAAPYTPQDLRSWIDGAVRFHEERGRWLPFLEEAGLVDPEIRQVRMELMRRCAEAVPILTHPREGFDAEAARFRFEILMIQLHRFAVYWVSGHWNLTRDQILGVLTDVWAQGLAVHPPQRPVVEPKSRLQ